MTSRHLSPADELIALIGDGLRTVLGPAPRPERPNPAEGIADPELSPGERDLSASLMRVDHAGEVCAQALYRGQAVTTRRDKVQETMLRAAAEENDHLAWTDMRLRELGSYTSYLNPLWYAGSFLIGAIAGLAGDRWNLGFVAETERQVVAHLTGHLERLPVNDQKSRAILEQMREDEGHHATTAIEAGAAVLPDPAKALMRLTSKVMTGTAYWI